MADYGFEIEEGEVEITFADREYEMRSGDYFETHDRFKGVLIRIIKSERTIFSSSSEEEMKSIIVGQKIKFDFLLLEGETAYDEWHGDGSDILTKVEMAQIFSECLSNRRDLLESFGYNGY